MGKPGRKSIWDTPPGSSPSLAEQDQGWGSQVETQTVPKPITPAVPIVEQLRVAKQVKRQRGWEQGNKTRSYWGIPLELREALGWIAQELCVKVDDVARAFFEYGLDEVQKGTLELIPHPNPKGPKMTLYPGGWKHQPWSRENWDRSSSRVFKQKPLKRKRVTQSAKGPACVLAVRHLPDELHQVIVATADACAVPIGEVAIKLLGCGLEAYRDGRLILNPVPVPGANTLFPVER
jgi:hypothetical protein